ncbi:MAG: hypothetical protein AB7F59_14645 [Bdellovibrionales bacterium]
MKNLLLGFLLFSSLTAQAQQTDYKLTFEKIRQASQILEKQSPKTLKIDPKAFDFLKTNMQKILDVGATVPLELKDPIDAVCSQRALAYVNKPFINVCPVFYTFSDGAQIQVLIHEFYHIVADENEALATLLEYGILHLTNTPDAIPSLYLEVVENAEFDWVYKTLRAIKKFATKKLK